MDKRVYDQIVAPRGGRSQGEEEWMSKKMFTAFDRLNEWIANNPDADAEEGAAELFDILMGKRDQ